jgi:hypothetical protein
MTHLIEKLGIGRVGSLDGVAQAITRYHGELSPGIPQAPLGERQAVVSVV